MENDFIRIINATYKLLDFFPDGEPLKNMAKERTLLILENLTLVFDTKGWASLKKEKAALQLSDDIEILENYLKLGKYQGWIDGINFLIIIKEYNELKGRINLPKEPIQRDLEILSRIESESREVRNQEKQVVPPVQKIVILEKSLPIVEGFTERQKKILYILSNREKTQVADIIKELPDITKRTIRRDLDDLLKKGKILRVGEWNQVSYQVNG